MNKENQKQIQNVLLPSKSIFNQLLKKYKCEPVDQIILQIHSLISAEMHWLKVIKSYKLERFCNEQCSVTRI